MEMVGADVVRSTYIDAVTRFRQPDGSYRQKNVFRYVTAVKPPG
jgi:hypothetical protein